MHCRIVLTVHSLLLGILHIPSSHHFLLPILAQEVPQSWAESVVLHALLLPCMRCYHCGHPVHWDNTHLTEIAPCHKGLPLLCGVNCVEWTVCSELCAVSALQQQRIIPTDDILVNTSDVIIFVMCSESSGYMMFLLSSRISWRQLINSQRWQKVCELAIEHPDVVHCGSHFQRKCDGQNPEDLDAIYCPLNKLTQHCNISA